MGSQMEVYCEGRLLGYITEVEIDMYRVCGDWTAKTPLDAKWLSSALDNAGDEGLEVWIGKEPRLRARIYEVPDELIELVLVPTSVAEPRLR